MSSNDTTHDTSNSFGADSWQRKAVERIAELTTVRELEDALGKPFMKALRMWRRQAEHRDTAGTKSELIEALLVQHGTDLLQTCKELRRIIGRSTKEGAPGAFHSGKKEAISFVREAQLPIELAGSPAPPRPPLAIVVHGPQNLRKLEDYQLEAQGRIADALRNGDAVVCSLPTGGGKTRVAIEAIIALLCEDVDVSVPGKPYVMWVAHTRELCDQAMEAFRVIWEAKAAQRSLLLGNTAAAGPALQTQLREAMQEHWDAAVIVTTPIVGAGLLTPGSWLSELREHEFSSSLRALIIDEAHRAAAPTYQRLIAAARRASPYIRVPVVGLTATPFRTVAPGMGPDAAVEALRSIFTDGLIIPKLLGEDPKGTLIKMECLALPIYTSIRGTDLSKVVDDRTQGEEWIDNELGKLAGQDARRRSRVFASLQELLQKSPTARVLYFGPTVTDAEVMSFVLLQQGYGAAVVSSKTHAPVRREIIQQFKAGAYRVLCNHGVLTTGFDDPQITHVVVARPTVSFVLYEQMVGRGLRGKRFGGTDECHILSVEDTFSGGPGLAKVWMEFIKSWTPHVRCTGTSTPGRRAGT